MSRTDPADRSGRDGRGEGAAAASTEARKAEHIRVNLREDVAAKGIGNGFDEYRFIHRALPEIDLAHVDTSAVLFDRWLAAPILISCMTGGTGEARQLNGVLARVAQRMRLAMGLGSGRVLLEHPELIDTFDVRAIAPDILLFANLGAVQLAKGYGVDDCRRLVSAVGADALVLHLNALQEAVQPEGDTCFAGLLARIGHLCERLEVPVVVKEVGWGIDPDTVRALLDAGVTAVDVAGAGGTSWSEVERYRATDPWRARVAAAFAGWGIPTAECLRQARRVAGDALIFASGGIRDGIDAAKAIALGADLVGLAGPFLRAAAAGEEEAEGLALETVEVLRIAMFAIGARTLAELRRTTRIRHRGEYLAARAASRRSPPRGPAVRREITPEDVETVVRGRGDTHERAD
jgi:isopentenyl-diphosphate delta-isomerase